MLRALALMTAVLATSGCNPTLANRAEVYQPLSGAIALKLKLEGQPDTRAEFTLDGQPLEPDQDGSDGYSVLVDTTAFPDGRHTLVARVLDGTGRQIQRLEHSLLFRNAGAQ